MLIQRVLYLFHITKLLLLNIAHLLVQPLNRTQTTILITELGYDVLVQRVFDRLHVFIQESCVLLLQVIEAHFEST